PNPSLNFTSLNTLYMNTALPQMQPRFADSDWATLEKQSAGGYLPGQWYVRREMTPILELTYADGTHSGMGYIELWLPTKNISGLSSAREIFTVSGPSLMVSSVAVRVQRASGSSPLTLRLEQGDGTLVEEGGVPAANVSTANPVWVTYSFMAAHQLTSGQSYHLTLTAPGDTIYAVFPMYKGVVYGFTSSSYFADGYAQYNNGTGWSGWSTSDGQTNRTTGDLQFYFGHSPMPPTNLHAVVQ
ncbi:MAG TPA: hypothetical protein VG498_24635, partial [Terriglobales bacterium]|nr:hypothetical protein [Terriglobales bacterium]